MFEKHKEKRPVKMRPVTPRSIGTTYFFRNRPLVSTLLHELSTSSKQEFSILFHACSIGAEVYSFVIQYLDEGYDKHFNIKCFATDKEQSFIDYARLGIYPNYTREGMHESEAGYFSNHGKKNLFRVVETVLEKVEFLPAANFVDFSTGAKYDVVFLLNCLVYVTQEQQSQTIDRVSRYNTEWLALTAFHTESIKADIDRNSYQPFTRNIREIHDSWLDRRVTSNVDERRPGIYANYSLPVFSEIPDYEYKYCSLFRKIPHSI